VQKLFVRDLRDRARIAGAPGEAGSNLEVAITRHRGLVARDGLAQDLGLRAALLASESREARSLLIIEIDARLAHMASIGQNVGYRYCVGEPLPDSGLDESFRVFLERQTEAEEAFVLGDAKPRMALWSRRDPVSLAGALGITDVGWERLAEVFPKVAAMFSDVSGFRYEVEVAEVLGDMAYTLGFERFNGSIGGRPVEDVEVRVTHVYRREHDEWRIVHRHGTSANLAR
jgi:ketosteroid isomerase-like protein